MANEVFYLENSGLIESVKKLLNDDDFKTICIDGAWGSGKTYFCKKLQDALSQKPEDPYVIYFNCFEEDSLGNPLLSLLLSIYDYFKDEKDVKTIKDAIQSIVSALFDIGGKVAFGVDNTSKRIRGEKESNSLVKSFLERKSKFVQLKEALRRTTEHKKLIIIMDELDRCKPTYSIEVFEIVKHIFDIESVKFVYTANVDALKKSILNVYGNIDADQYLQKFADVFVTLPDEVSTDSCVKTSRVYLYFQDKLNTVADDAPLKYILFPAKGARNQHGWQCYKMVECLIKYWHLSMRDVDKLIRYLRISYIFNSYISNQAIPVVFMSFVFAVLKRKDTEQFLHKTSQDVCSFLDNFFVDCENDISIVNDYLNFIRQNNSNSEGFESNQRIFSNIARDILRVKC